MVVIASFFGFMAGLGGIGVGLGYLVKALND